jgi:hypothetical protein
MCWREDLSEWRFVRHKSHTGYLGDQNGSILLEAGTNDLTSGNAVTL